MNTPLSPHLKLALSRERLRQALAKNRPPLDVRQRPDSGDDALVADLGTATGRDLLRVIGRNWWRQHPLRLRVEMATEAAELVLQPVAQTHPYGLVLGSAVAGAVLVRLRPWRWWPASALLAGLLPQVVSVLGSLKTHRQKPS